ncbi:MAG: Rv3654c family TadE-like protein [Jatrophihabitans sp.]|uniref:Rv3654c family TadE-like protein n=1 Tax=Jatrophihabitans sp. TaxID=1932789 RepID=UPI0039152216
MSARRAEHDRGSAVIWVVSCCVLLTVAATVATVRTLAVLARHRAEAGADLAALAAAGRIGRDDAEACPAAARIADRNWVRLVSCDVRLAPDGRSGQVLVRVELRARLPLVGPRAVAASARGARLPSAPGRRRSTRATAAASRPPSDPYGPRSPPSVPVACWLPSSERAPP